MQLIEIKRTLAEYGNVAVASITLEQTEVTDFLRQIEAKVERGFCKNSCVCKITAYYELSPKDWKEVQAQKEFQKEAQKKKIEKNARSEYKKILKEIEARRNKKKSANGQ